MCWFKRNPELELNDKGYDVLEASRLLRSHGSKMRETMHFTIGMRSAVVNFQKKHNLEPTGVIDKAAWKALRKKA